MKVKRWKIVITMATVVILGIAALVFLNLPKPVSSSDSAYDLSQISDGTYFGNCDNGIVKVRVEVEVQNNTIVGVRITDHQNGLGSPAEVITDDILKLQSIEVDAISSATISSKTILKAVENALSGAVE